MSTSKTKNLQLHAWAGEDPFLRAEFNDNFAAIDDNAGKTWGEIAKKADSSTLAALETVVSAVQSAMPKIAYGSYTGNGELPMELELPFPPKFVALARTQFTGCAVITGSSGPWVSLSYNSFSSEAIGSEGSYSVIGNTFKLNCGRAEYSMNSGVCWYFAVG